MPPKSFLKRFNSLLKISGHYDASSHEAKIKLLTELSKSALSGGKKLVAYHDLLLFFCAYPADKKILNLTEKELQRIAVLGKKLEHTKNEFPENEGLPFSITLTRFSPEFLSWLLHHKDLSVAFDSFYNPTLSLNDILNITLPPVLKAETTASLSNEDLLEVLGIAPNKYAAFLLGQLDTLNDSPQLKELFMERMDFYVKLLPKNKLFSRAFNRLPIKKVFYHAEILKSFDHQQLINKALPEMLTPDETEREAYDKIIKNAMALTVREIDPATFLKKESMRIFNLERGLTIAIYAMEGRHQLPLETYFGFTFIKNGIPVSYGGIWTFGRMAKLGLNIFEPFRGGESGYILTQLIRVCKQFLGATYFEVEPYQFGLENPDGIKSGAFWFYYKFGFKPVDKDLNTLAEKEKRKIKSNSKYRSSEKTLIEFTASNVGLNLEEGLPKNVQDLKVEILTALKKDWQNNYAAARLQSIVSFCKKVKINFTELDNLQKNVLEEIALWAMSSKVTQPKKLKLMRQMVFAKTKDDYAYQQLLLKFFQD